MGELVDYDDFTVTTPTSSDKVVGGIGTDNYVYCRKCIERLGKNWNSMKFIVNSKAKAHIYNCCVCGWRVTQKRANSI